MSVSVLFDDGLVVEHIVECDSQGVADECLPCEEPVVRLLEIIGVRVTAICIYFSFKVDKHIDLILKL